MKKDDALKIDSGKACEYGQDMEVVPKGSFINRINEIYGDFKSRACGNCEWAKEDSNFSSVWIDCMNKKSAMYGPGLISEKGYPNIIDFSCSKWESK